MGGFAFCSCGVYSNGAEIKILSFPLPDDSPEDGSPAKDHVDKVRHYIQREQVPIARALPLRRLRSKSEEIFSEGEGIWRQDWRDSKLERLLDSRSTCIAERSIPVGAQVCVFGIYSSEKRGLLQKNGLGGLMVLQGTVDEGIREFQRRGLVSMIFVVICLTVGTLGVHLFLSSLH